MLNLINKQTNQFFSIGYYCPTNSSDYSANPCPSGRYCPENTTRGDQYLCPLGTFNPATGQSSSSACLPCTAGFYCQTQGLAGPTGNCSAGKICRSLISHHFPALYKFKTYNEGTLKIELFATV